MDSAKLFIGFLFAGSTLNGLFAAGKFVTSATLSVKSGERITTNIGETLFRRYLVIKGQLPSEVLQVFQC